MEADRNAFSDDREIEEEHSAIRAIMHWIEVDLIRQSDSEGGVRGEGPLLGPLRAFREHLSKHFEFEERSGVLPAALMAFPDPARALANWRREHETLLVQLDACLRVLERSAKTRSAVPSPFEENLTSFFEALRRHDAFENGLLGEERVRTFRSAQGQFGKSSERADA